MTIANPTPILGLEQQVDGTNNSTWGDRVNANFARIDKAFNVLSLDVTAGNITLKGADSGDTSSDAQTRYGIIRVIGSPTAARAIIWPVGSPWREYLIVNSSTQPVIFSVSGQPGTKLQAHGRQLVVCNAVDIVHTAQVIQATSPGYEYRAGGILDEWGSTGSTNSSGQVYISFFPAFSANPWDVQVTQVALGGAVAACSVHWETLTASSVLLQSLQGFSFRWRAIGPA